MAIILNNLSDLKMYIQAQINATLRTDVKDEVVGMIGEMALDKVYGVYNPRMYQRRDSLLDPENYDGEVSDGVLTVRSTASPNYSYNGQYDYTVHNLAELIEYGHREGDQMYSYPPSSKTPYGQPRPFMEPTHEKLAQGDILKNIIKKGLQRHGLTVK